jgi:hypothetical protein
MNQQLAGLTPAQRDALRLAGATLFATGALALFLRKNFQDSWAAFPRLLVLAIPCVLLYGLGTGMIRLGRPDTDLAGAWRATALVFGLVLIPFTLFQLVETLGGDPDKSGHTAWVFAITAAAGAYAALAHGLRWGALFGGLALIVSWIAFWDAVVEPSATAIRWLFLIVAAVLAAAAFRLDEDGGRVRPELVTAAGVAALAAGITGLFSLPAQLIGTGVAEAFGTEAGVSGTQQQQEWDVFLLVLAVALVWYGARAAWRGPVYVGALALFAFILSIGIEVSRIFDGDAPGGDLMGWPLLLLVLGGGALAAGLYGGGGSTREPPPAAAPPPPAAPPT